MSFFQASPSSAPDSSADNAFSGGIFSAASFTRNRGHKEQELDNFSCSIMTAATSVSTKHTADSPTDQHAVVSMQHSPEAATSAYGGTSIALTHQRKMFNEKWSMSRQHNRLDGHSDLDNFLEHSADPLCYGHEAQGEIGHYVFDEFSLDYRPGDNPPVDVQYGLGSSSHYPDQGNAYFLDPSSALVATDGDAPGPSSLSPASLAAPVALKLSSSVAKLSSAGPSTSSAVPALEASNTDPPRAASFAGPSSRVKLEIEADVLGSSRGRMQQEVPGGASARSQYAVREPARRKNAQNGRSEDELMMLDPKRVKRILANRQSAARSKERRVRYASELEEKYANLQSDYDHVHEDVSAMKSDNSMICKTNVDLESEIQQYHHRHSYIYQENKSYVEELYSLQSSLGMEQHLPEVHMPNSCALPPLPDFKLQLEYHHPHATTASPLMQESVCEHSAAVNMDGPMPPAHSLPSPNFTTASFSHSYGQHQDSIDMRQPGFYGRPKTQSMTGMDGVESSHVFQGRPRGLQPPYQYLRRDRSLPSGPQGYSDFQTPIYHPAPPPVMHRHHRFSDPGTAPSRGMPPGTACLEPPLASGTRAEQHGYHGHLQGYQPQLTSHMPSTQDMQNIGWQKTYSYDGLPYHSTTSDDLSHRTLLHL